MKPREFCRTLTTFRRRDLRKHRKGIVLVLTCLLAPILFGFLAYSVDTGLTSMTQTRMQNAADASALAASQEIRAAIAAASAGQGDAQIDANSIAVTEARAMAVRVAAANGVYIDPERDVVFGRRSYDAETNAWPVQWGEAPFNTVRVDVHRDNTNSNAPDAALPLNFGMFLGKPSVALSTGASAFVEARDLVLVLDYSGSMSYDSQLRSAWSLGADAIIENQKDMFDALEANAGYLTSEPQYLTLEGQPASGPVPHISVTFMGNSIYAESSKDLSNVVIELEDGTHYKFDDLNQGQTGEFTSPDGQQIYKCWIKSGSNDSGDGPGYGESFDDTYDAVKAAFNLDNTPYPFNHGSWTEFLDHARCNDNKYADIQNAGLERTYGGPTFVNYLLEKRKSYYNTENLWKTPEYPFHAMKNGVSLLLDFVDDLDFGDEVGIISYGSYARWETELDFDGYNIDIGSDPITSEYASLDAIQRHRQAAHYSSTTAMGDGIKQARELLEQNSRYGSRPTVLVITDGNANVAPSDWSLPDDWDWDELTDYDGDGHADYTTTNRNKQYSFWEATEGMDRGYTFHTMTVGAGADRALMEAISFAGEGVWIDVPGGGTVESMEAQMLDAFSEIAGRVPPPTLVYDTE
jgi:uncharacterized protein (TIGR02145 family)